VRAGLMCDAKEPPRQQMKARIIFNPAAGQGDFHQHLKQAVEYLESGGWQIDEKRTRSRGDGIDLARQAAESGCDIVIAVGGDGTINEVVNGLAGSSTALGVIPAGTANVYAADVGIPIWSPLRPMAVREAARIIQEGQRWSIDLGRVTFSNRQQRYFFMWCGVGLDAAITHEVTSEQTRRLGLAAWVLVGAIVAVTYLGHRSSVTVDAREERMRMLWAVISNGQLYGRVLRFAPEARMDDGLLNMTVLEGYGIMSTLRHLGGLLLGRYARDPTKHQYVGKAISIETRRPLPVHVDAEPLGTTPVQIEVVPQALTVIWPQRLPAHLITESVEQPASGLFAGWNPAPDQLAQKVKTHVMLRLSEIFRGISEAAIEGESAATEEKSAPRDV
jgi:diacylglycerol kinase (ATP)